jgi:isocitrate dehydrogenase
VTERVKEAAEASKERMKEAAHGTAEAVRHAGEKTKVRLTTLVLNACLSERISEIACIWTRFPI